MQLILFYFAVWLECMKYNIFNLKFGRLTAARPRTYMAIALHESAGFTSNVWNRANNAVGMRPPSWSNRWYGEYNGYAYYKNAFLCGLDFMQWMRRNDCMQYGYGALWALCKHMKERGYFEADFEAYWENCVYFVEKWQTRLSLLNALSWIMMAVIPSIVTIMLLMPKGVLKNKFKTWTSKKLWKL